jgi:hypothetical protein
MAAEAIAPQLTILLQQYDDALYRHIVRQIATKHISSWKKQCLTFAIRYLFTMVHIHDRGLADRFIGVLRHFSVQLPMMPEDEVSRQLREIGSTFHRYTEFHSSYDPRDNVKPLVSRFDLDTYLRLSTICLASTAEDDFKNLQEADAIDKIHTQQQRGMGAVIIQEDYVPVVEEKDREDYVMVQRPTVASSTIHRAAKTAVNVASDVTGSVASGTATATKNLKNASQTVGSFVWEAVFGRGNKGVSERKKKYNKKQSKQRDKKKNKKKNKNNKKKITK